jgi:Leucine-rich repeat (LRR) protein
MDILPGGALSCVCTALRRGEAEPGGVNALRNTCHGLRDALDAHAIESAVVTWDDKGTGLAWLAWRFPGLTALDVSAPPNDAQMRIDERAVGSLRSLVTLKVRNLCFIAGMVALPPGLRVLDLCGCSGLNDTMMACPASLTDVDVSHCATDSLLDWTRKLVGLRRLCVAWSRGLSDLSALADHGALTYLNISGCGGVSRVVVPPSLQVLRAMHCSGLADLSPLSVAPGLTSLSVCHSSRLTSLADIGCRRLKEAYVTYTGLPDLRDLRNFRALETLTTCLRTREDEATLTALGGTLVSLELQRHHGGPQDPDVAWDLRGLTRLRSLKVVHGWIDVTGFASLRSLTRLDMCKQADNAMVASIGAMTALQELHGLMVGAVTDFAPFAALRALRTLVLHYSGVPDSDMAPAHYVPLAPLAPLAMLTGLRTLEIKDCTRPSCIVPLASLSALTSLSIPYVWDGDLGPVAALTGLRTLDVGAGPRRLDDMSPLTALTALTSFTIRDFGGALPWRLPQALRSVQLSGCTKVRDLSSLTTLTALSTLYMNGCGRIDLAHVAAMTTLTNLTIKYMALNDVSPLTALTGLRHLLIIDAVRPTSGIRGVPDVAAACKRLRKGVCGFGCMC